MSEIAELRAEMARLRGRLDEIESAQADAPVPRRHMLRALGGMAAGAAVGGLAFAKPAAAADGDFIELGREASLASSATLVGVTGTYTAGGQGGIFGVTDNILGGGIKLFDESGGFSDELAQQVADDLKDSTLSGSAADSSVSTGIVGTGINGIKAYGVETGISAFGGQYGGGFEGRSIGLVADGSGDGAIGAKLSGDTPLKLVSNSAPPSSAVGGQFKFHAGTLYFGVGLGSGNWRRLASPASAGAFVPVTPFRVYDSRFVSGRLATGSNSTIDCSDAIDVLTGEVSTADALPSDARAIAYTVTAVDTSGGGYLAVTPATATEVTASTINWSSPNTLANSSIVGISNRQVKVFCGGGPGTAADFIIDIVGYYH